jgi:Rad3-related DNA helicase
MFHRWLEETETGDVDELPFMLSGDLRPRIVSFPDDCLHTDCRYLRGRLLGQPMRDAAAQAQVLITNHHLLLNALELGYAGERILPPRRLYVIDEAHHLEQIATAVYETVVSDFVVEQLLAARHPQGARGPRRTGPDCATSTRWLFGIFRTQPRQRLSRSTATWKHAQARARAWELGQG